MPFRKERYPADWKEIRAGIIERAENRCEQCRAPNRTVICRGMSDSYSAGTYMLEHGEVFDETTGAARGIARGSEYDGRFTTVTLTVAHLDHDEQNNAPENLRALCQRCHFAHDRADNTRRRRAAAQARNAAGRLPGT